MKHVKNLFYLAGFLFMLLLGLHEGTKLVRAGVACSVPNTFSNGTTADATQVNANFSALVACFANTAEAGANSSITALTGLTTPLTPAQGGTTVYVGGTSAGTNTVTLATPVPAGFALQPGSIIYFTLGGTNSGITTLAIGANAAKPVRRLTSLPNGVAELGGYEWLGGGTAVVYYDGTQYITLTNFAPGMPGFITDYAGVGCPLGWLEANGGSFVTANFPALNAVLSTTWGIAGTLPDLRGRSTAGRDSGGSGRITAAGGNFDGTVVGGTGGQQGQPAGIDKSFLKSFALSVTDPGHTHNMNWTNTGNLAATGASNYTSALTDTASNRVNTTTSVATGVTVNSGGSGTAFPTLTNTGIVTKCVKL